MAALLVGFAIPTSFLLCFAFLAIKGVSISNIVMFGLILAVGMLVDGAIVVVEYADKRISDGVGPMHAYVEAAKRMFWPVVSSTATTLCAFLPMLFWPGVAGEFMGMLPVTLIFVLSASLVVALIYLPVMGGVSGRFSRSVGRASDGLRARVPWVLRAVLAVIALLGLFVGAMMLLDPGYLFPPIGPGLVGRLPGALIFLVFATLSAVAMGSVTFHRRARRIDTRSHYTAFGWLTKIITGNPILPLVTVGAVLAFVVVTFGYYGQNNKGTEFFVESEPEQAIVYVRARGNLSLTEKDALVRQVESIVLAHPGIDTAFAFAGEGGLDSNTGGAQPPKDTIGQIQLETIPWEDRFGYAATHDDVTLAMLDGDVVVEDLTRQLNTLPGVEIEILSQAQGPASAKPVHLRVAGDDWGDLLTAAATARQHFEETPGLVLIEDTRPLPGIDWQIDVDVEKAGRFGADVASVGAMVQLVTRGILLDTMRVDTSDEEIEIRVRLPREDRVLSTLDNLKVRTTEGLVPLSNFITRQPVPKLATISRVDQQRFYDVKADVAPGLAKVVTTGPDGGEERLAVVRDLSLMEGYDGETYTAPNGTGYGLVTLTGAGSAEALEAALEDGARFVPINANERIEVLTEWLQGDPLPASVSWEWTGDQEEQAESQAFLSSAFGAALGLMFIILLAQFNSFYNSVLVLLAVVLSTTGVLIGMMVMQQPFSIIMTGTGIVALAGIVVNNNIVLIDTYQEYSRYMPRIEAIIYTTESRIRPVLLTTITTMAGLAPMMFGISLDFINGGYTIDSPTALWWKQLATAVVFGLGVATVLTLVVTPSLLAIRVWFATYVGWFAALLARLSMGRSSQAARDWALRRSARKAKIPEILWGDEREAEAERVHAPGMVPPLKAAE